MSPDPSLATSEVDVWKGEFVDTLVVSLMNIIFDECLDRRFRV
jgi:hypothetical protein